MIKGTYVGDQYPELKGETALILPGHLPDSVKAQFDRADLTREVPEVVDYNHHTGRKMIEEPARMIRWGYGWHSFPKKDFTYD